MHVAGHLRVARICPLIVLYLQVSEELPQFRRKRPLKMDSLSSNWVNKFQCSSVKKIPVQRELLRFGAFPTCLASLLAQNMRRSVERVANHRMTDGSEVYTNLMSPSGFDLNIQ